MAGWQEFTGLNRGYVLELYEQYRKDPSSVDPETRALFEHWTPPARGGAGWRGHCHPARQSCRRGQPGAVDPALRASRRAARSARLAAAAAIRRSCPRRTASPRTTSGAAGEPDRRRRSTAQASTMHDAGRRVPPHLLLDDRLRLRARVRARGARVAAPGRRGRTLPRAGRSDRSGRAARPADAGRGVRALPAPHVSRQDALLDRRARHARADPRRGDRRGGRGRHPARS